VLGESASATMGACWPGARCQGAVVRPGGGGRRVTRSWMDGLATTCPQPRGRGARPRGGGGGMVEVTPHGAQGGAPSVAGAAAEGGELAEARP
jgi:hypothetical protein